MIQESEYYAFGLNRTLIDNGNKYLYNNKEKQIDLNNQFDYGARFYDPVIARWTSVDKLADHPDQIDVSPYAYVANNPIIRTDPNGNFWPILIPLIEAVAEYVTTETIGEAIFVGGGTAITLNVTRNSGIGYMSAPRDATYRNSPNYTKHQQLLMREKDQIMKRLKMRLKQGKKHIGKNKKS